MMNIRYALSIGCICVLLYGVESVRADTRVNVRNAEDLAPLDDGRWVLASSMLGGVQTQGGIYAIDVRSGKTRSIYPNNEVVKSSMKDCPAPVVAAAFSPHGIALFKNAKGETLLYVVNHGGRESIEMFAVEQQRDTPTLSWRGCIVAPAGVVGNAVAVAHDIVYMTNMGKPLDGSAPISPIGGNVLAWTAANGWRDVAGSSIAAPNGLLVSADGRVLYVASWTRSEVVRLTLTEAIWMESAATKTVVAHPALSLNGLPQNELSQNGLQPTGVTRDELKISLLPDNLRWSDDGAIFATGHHARVAAVTDCFMAKGRCEKTIPSALTKIDTAGFTVRCAEDLNQSMATTTVNVGDELWIGTARGENILRTPRTALKCH